MEHLMRNNQPAPINVPYVLPDDFSYDGGDFESYPGRNGWNLTLPGAEIDVESWLESCNSGKTVEDLAEFLQAWLFFGFLEAVLQRKVPPADFVRTRETQGTREKLITTTKLRPNLTEFKTRTDNYSMQMRYDLAEHLLAVQSVIPKVVRLFEMWTPSNQDKLKLIVFSLCLVHEVWHCVTFVLSKPYSFVVYLEAFKMLQSRMLSEGWCPSIIFTLRQSSYISPMAYAYAVGTRRSKQGHAACTSARCELNQTAEGVIKPAHDDSSCTCELIGPPVDAIVHVLEEGYIPVLEVNDLDEDSAQSPSFTVRRADGTKYIAISHVWADGLGNSNANTIPRCQLKLLLQALKDDDDNGACSSFWLDTLCIPVDKSFQRLRDFSIQKMHSIYKDSFGVLVLDRDLSLASKDSYFLEVANRMVLSAWATRLWTFQEGDLPPRLFVRVQGGKMNFDQLRKRWFANLDELNPLDRFLGKAFESPTEGFIPRRSGEDGGARRSFDEML